MTTKEPSNFADLTKRLDPAALADKYKELLGKLSLSHLDTEALLETQIRNVRTDECQSGHIGERPRAISAPNRDAQAGARKGFRSGEVPWQFRHGTGDRRQADQNDRRVGKQRDGQLL